MIGVFLISMIRILRAKTTRATWVWIGSAVWLLVVGGGCQHPSLMPMTPCATRTVGDGTEERSYDTDHDGRPDVTEVISSQGRTAVLRIDADGDGDLEKIIDLDRIERADCRNLLIILDSVPYEMVRQAWDHGRLRYFYPPARVVAPFPVMTDLSLAEFFHVSPCPGVEASYFDGRRMSDPYDVYLSQGNAPWMERLNYYLPTSNHDRVYLWPYTWLFNELSALEKSFLSSRASPFLTYMISPSAVGARYGRDGHQKVLITIDRFCQALMKRFEGRLQITLMSDHGHNLIEGRFMQLSAKLAELGYHVGSSLKSSEDVVVPEFGPVTCAAVYTRKPDSVAADLAGLEGVDLVFYRNEQDEIVVLNRSGRARIDHSENRFRYRAEWGDPLQLAGALESLKQSGLMDESGFVSDKIFWDMTAHGMYPDVIHRIWRSFHGLMIHPPDVLVSLDEGWYNGSPFLAFFIQLKAAHGSLHETSSIGFAMTTSGPLPESVRMEDLAEALQSSGFTIFPKRTHHPGGT